MKQILYVAVLLASILVLLVACNQDDSANMPYDYEEDYQDPYPNGEEPTYEPDEPGSPDSGNGENPPPAPTTPEPTPEPAEGNNADDTPAQQATGTAPGVSIIRLVYEEGPGPLADLSFMHIVDLGSGMDDSYVGDNLMIRVDADVRDFAVITMENDMADDDVIFRPAGVVGGMVNNFAATDGFIIYDYMSMGTLPHLGIRFTDENGQRWHFAILQNQAYPNEGDAYMLIPLASSPPYEVLTFLW